MLCPNCREPIDPVALRCPHGHRFGYQNGVLVLLEPAFARRLNIFATRLSEIRAAEGQRLPDPTIYEQLPFAPSLRKSHEWRARCYDLALVARLLRGRGRLRILDIGAWNGWLSHRLSALGHNVTGVDYFADEYDGLGARKFYSHAWHPIQLDLTDLFVLGERFDAVIVNRCLAFFSDPHAFVAATKEMVAPGGLLIVTGLELFRDASVKAAYVAALQQRYQQQYNFELFLAPTKGYLDFEDRACLSAQEIAVRHYPQLWAANLKALLRPTLPRHCYGVWERTKN